MNILLTGRTGQVGFELLRALAPLGRLHAPGRERLDLCDEAGIRTLVRALAPEVIVNAAAYTAVDGAESDAETAFAVNATAPRILGEEAARLGALVLHFSTDYVFNGEHGLPYTERDQPQPCNVYGLSKWQGEQELTAACGRHLVFRTSWVLGAHGRNFAKTVLRLAQEKDSFDVVADQCGAPTTASLLADLSAHVLRQYQQDHSRAFGTYHVAAAGATTWYDYARFVLEKAVAAGKPLRAGPEAIRPVATNAYPTPARRPRNSRLDTALFRATFGLRLPSWEEGVAHVLQQTFESE